MRVRPCPKVKLNEAEISTILVNNMRNIIGPYIRELNLKITNSLDSITEIYYQDTDLTFEEKRNILLNCVEFLDSIDLLGESYIANFEELTKKINDRELKKENDNDYK